MKVGVVVFPGSNCDHDAWYAINRNLRDGLHASAEFIWHDSTNLGNVDSVILPGGFSYGDYLRCGAIARFSPVMAAVGKFAADGGLVLGVCNGFQILVEAGLLPGALLRNQDLKFICREVGLRTETTDSPFTSKLLKGQRLHLPIAHGEGRYFADEQTLDALEAEGRIAFRYVDNPNGSIRNIAGILSRERNVLGMMPHPERVCDALMGSIDGLGIFESMLCFCGTGACPHEMTITPELIQQHQLTPAEYQKIVSLLGREPTYTELGVFSVMWSEHCSYKSSRIHLKKLPHARQTRCAGTWRERRHHRDRRRLGSSVQDRIAQSPELHQPDHSMRYCAAARCGRDRRRRHSARHLHHGRAPDRRDGLAPLRPSPQLPECRAQSPHSHRRGRRHRALWQLLRRP